MARNVHHFRLHPARSCHSFACPNQCQWYTNVVTGACPELANSGTTISGTGYDGAIKTYTSESISTADAANDPSLLVAATPTHMFCEAQLWHSALTYRSGYQSQMGMYFDNVSIRRKDET